MKAIGLATFLVLACAAGPAPAQTFPTRPIHIVVPFPPGGSADISSRILAESMGKRLGTPIIVDNRPGGGTVIGTQAVQHSPADGYTALVVFPSFVINPSMRPDIQYRLQDFRALGQTISLPMVIAVNPAVPASSLKELVELARAKPGSIAYGTPGPASTHRIAAEMFRIAAGIDLTHAPYSGGAPAMTAVIGGHIQMVYLNVNEVVQQVNAGKVRALVVTTAERAESLPNVPTFRELGYPQLEASNWSGLVVPAATPNDVVAKLNFELVRALKDPQVLEKFKAQELVAAPGTPEEFDRFLRSESARYAEVIRKAGIKGD